ncbi:transcriptional repressor [Actinacidiphila alni]|uniref:Fur family transcriptional regulator n=1 Tax=Actinacidiphila alni TaxID=380248 RepID=UPI0033C4A995
MPGAPGRESSGDDPLTGTAAPESPGDVPLPGRRTPQRRTLLRALIDADGFVSAQSLHADVVRAGPAVGLSTVYRTLAALTEAGLADTVREPNGERLFRYRPSRHHQHYLLCRCCGTSSPVDAADVESWVRTVTAASGYTEVEHTVELTGICAPCGAERRTP